MNLSINLNLTLDSEEKEGKLAELITILQSLADKPPPSTKRQLMMDIIDKWSSQYSSLKHIDKGTYSTIHSKAYFLPVVYLSYHSENHVYLYVDKNYIEKKTPEMSDSIRFFNTVEVACGTPEELESVLDLIKYKEPTTA